MRVLEDGTAKILDFGIAKLVHYASDLTQTGMTVGTAAYLAPEQIRGEEATPETDIFSFGVLAYELLTYVRPFGRETISETFYQTLNRQPTAVTVHWENGWQAVADRLSPYPPADIDVAMERLERGRALLQEHGNYDWLTGSGNFVISNNGIEWAATYFIMLLALFFLGGGKYLSADYWITKRFRNVK